MNKVILTGRFGADVDTRYTQSGTAVANVNLATTEYAKGEKKTEWHRLVMFGKTAELAAEYTGKGSQVGVEGRLQTRKWEKDGQTRYTTEVVVDRIEFLDSKQKGDEPPVSREAPGPVDDDEQIPF